MKNEEFQEPAHIPIIAFDIEVNLPQRIIFFIHVCHLNIQKIISKVQESTSEESQLVGELNVKLQMKG